MHCALTRDMLVINNTRVTRFRNFWRPLRWVSAAYLRRLTSLGRSTPTKNHTIRPIDVPLSSLFTKLETGELLVRRQIHLILNGPNHCTT